MDFLSALTLSVGMGINSPIQTSDYFSSTGRFAGHLKLEHEESNFNIWGSYYDKDHILMGQPISKSALFATGVGYDIDLSDKLELQLGVGWAFNIRSNIQQVPSYATNQADSPYPIGASILGEAAFTYLVGRHNKPGRDIPLPIEEYENYKQDYGSGWKIRDDVFLRVGLAYDISSQWELGAQLNIFNPKSNLWIARSEIAQDVIDEGLINPCEYEGGCGFWVEDTTWGMNSLEFTINYRW